MSADEHELLEVGRIGKAHGLRGEVSVSLVTNRVERVAPGARLYVDDRVLEVASSRPHQERFLVQFVGVDGREAAETLRGQMLRAEPLDDPDELWVHELIGAVVVDTAGVEHGTVATVLDNPAAALLELDDGTLVPTTFVVEIVAGDSVVVDAPDGIFNPDAAEVAREAP